MTNSSDPKKGLKDPPFPGGSNLAPHSEGFMLPEDKRMALAFKQAYVLGLLAMQTDPSYSLRDQYLRTFAERMSGHFVLSLKPGISIAMTPPSPKTLRLWRRKYIDASCNPLALLPSRPRPNRSVTAPLED